ncbi:DUF6197 family protein [Kitasatospora sp. NPDC001175]|uniref:DUF6197 family protein n=1 Tax=Kitasatospora sp. NPDC001175 TaxID=3157103 RepID=UPI003D0705B1
MIGQPTDRHTVLAKTAQIIQVNGLHHGDFVADPFNRTSKTPHYQRPMSVVGAIRCAVAGDPHIESLLAWEAIAALSQIVRVDGEPARSETIADQERHVEEWSDRATASLVINTLMLASGRRVDRRVVAA